MLTVVLVYGFMCDGGSNGAVVGLGGNLEKIVVLVGWDVKGLVEKEGPACMLRSLCPSKNLHFGSVGRKILLLCRVGCSCLPLRGRIYNF